MSVEISKTVTCDRCGKSPLETHDWHDGYIRLGAADAKHGGINYPSVDLCKTCHQMLRAGLVAFFAGATVTVKR